MLKLKQTIAENLANAMNDVFPDKRAFGERTFFNAGISSGQYSR